MRAVLLALTLAGCAPATASDAKRDRPTIVSLNPCADAILARVTAPGQLLAISHYSHDPRASSMAAAHAQQFASTGGSVEEVLALAPDVVVADSFLAPATRHALERSGVRVEVVGIAATLEDSTAQVRSLARLTGEGVRGEALVDAMESAWEANSHSGDSIDTLLWQSGGIVPGEQTLIAAMLDAAGFSLHSAAQGMGQGSYLPLEQVLADPPDLVLAAGEEAMLSHPVLREVGRMKYRSLDPTLLYCGGPTIIRAMEHLGQIRRELS